MADRWRGADWGVCYIFINQWPRVSYISGKWINNLAWHIEKLLIYQLCINTCSCISNIPIFSLQLFPLLPLQNETVPLLCIFSARNGERFFVINHHMILIILMIRFIVFSTLLLYLCAPLASVLLWNLKLFCICILYLVYFPFCFYLLWRVSCPPVLFFSV